MRSQLFRKYPLSFYLMGINVIFLILIAGKVVVNTHLQHLITAVIAKGKPLVFRLLLLNI
jgi:hypothetical protein